jgi:hypothetical protein
MPKTRKNLQSIRKHTNRNKKRGGTYADIIERHLFTTDLTQIYIDLLDDIKVRKHLQNSDLNYVTNEIHSAIEQKNNEVRDLIKTLIKKVESNDVQYLTSLRGVDAELYEKYIKQVFELAPLQLTKKSVYGTQVVRSGLSSVLPDGWWNHT